MRIVWVGKGADEGSQGGDAVYDRKLLQHVERHHSVFRFAPEPVALTQKFANLARGVPLYRATYCSRATIARLSAFVAEVEPDVVAISWESFDFLAAHIDLPTVLLLHNITSDAVVEVFRGNVLSRIYAAWIRRWERRLYGRSTVAALVALSVRDRSIAAGLVAGKPVETIAPGMPLLAPPPNAELRPELLISGTYDWYPKRRDLMRIARDMAETPAMPFKMCWDHRLPAAAGHLLVGEKIDVRNWPPALRFGLVPDTFASGFKLKVAYYIANNAIVLSEAEVGGDYRDIVDSDLFIRRVSGVRDMMQVYAEFAALDPARLAARFEAFKQACAERFHWESCALHLCNVLVDAAASTKRREKALHR